VCVSERKSDGRSIHEKAYKKEVARDRQTKPDGSIPAYQNMNSSPSKDILTPGLAHHMTSSLSIDVTEMEFLLYLLI
jgi:hypothetical protein